MNLNVLDFSIVKQKDPEKEPPSILREFQGSYTLTAESHVQTVRADYSNTVPTGAHTAVYAPHRSVLLCKFNNLQTGNLLLHEF